MSPSSHVLRILVVEDEPDIRDLLVAGLAEEGPAEVEAAADGEEALRLLERGPRPSVILLDLRMPVLSGEGVLRALEEQPGHPPVVTMSACTRMAPRGAAGHLDKPFSIREALSALRRVCVQTGALHSELPPGALPASPLA
ncbi:MAG TPA: response regulator [Anaeromyxobacter sp.]|nr:response regulator [Anaeromyxobacter sp.]